MQRVTIKDIARMAGVSVTTVSRALNGAPEISGETRERIMEICRREGYRTNLLARSLSASRTNVIGVVLPDISGPFHAALAWMFAQISAVFARQPAASMASHATLTLVSAMLAAM